MIDFNGLFAGVFLIFGIIYLIGGGGLRQLSFLPFDPRYAVYALGACALFLITRGQELAIEGDRVSRVTLMLWSIPIGRTEYRPGTFKQVRLRAVGSGEGVPAYFVELVGDAYLPLTQLNEQAARQLAEEVGASLGIPVGH